MNTSGKNDIRIEIVENGVIVSEVQNNASCADNRKVFSDINDFIKFIRMYVTDSEYEFKSLETRRTV